MNPRAKGLTAFLHEGNARAENVTTLQVPLYATKTKSKDQSYVLCFFRDFCGGHYMSWCCYDVSSRYVTLCIIHTVE